METGGWAGGQAAFRGVQGSRQLFVCVCLTLGPVSKPERHPAHGLRLGRCQVVIEGGGGGEGW